MLTKLKELSTQAKVAIGAGLAALLAIGIGLAVWQPWNQPEEPPAEPDQPQQQEPVSPQQPEEESFSVRLPGEDVACDLYKGEGWSICVPQGWDAAANGNGAVFTAPDGAEMRVDFLPVDSGANLFVSLSALDGTRQQVQFCGGNGTDSPVVTGSASNAQWDRYGRLFAALAKTLAVGEETPLAGSYVVPQEPDWQEAEGDTILFLGKDGVILDDEVQTAVEDYMRSWPQEERTVFTGQYRVNGISWAASYTGLTSGYIDVFKARVQYRIAEGGEETVRAREGVTVADGWASLPEDVFLVLMHDGSGVDQSRSVAAEDTGDWMSFVELLQ